MKPTEHEEQSVFFDLVRLHANSDARLENVVAIPNAGKRSMGALNYYKAEGLSAGFPDVAVLVAACGFHGLFIEFKRRPNKPSEAQKDWLNRLSARGYFCIVAYSGLAAFETLQEYFAGNLQRDR